jgi:hypothetical protein
LRFRVNKIIGLDMAGAVPLRTLPEESVDEGLRRALFEAFMQEHGVLRGDGAAALLSYWRSVSTA